MTTVIRIIFFGVIFVHITITKKKGNMMVPKNYKPLFDKLEDSEYYLPSLSPMCSGRNYFKL
jgi:hypothetical protein